MFKTKNSRKKNRNSGLPCRHYHCYLGQFFLLVDLRDFSFRFRVGEEKGGKALKMTSQLVIFRAFFNISRTNSETSKIKQQSVLNL